MTHTRLFEKGKIGSLELSHRILMGSMHLGIEGDREQLNQVKAFYVERAKGEAALMITGGVAVLPEGSGDHMYCLTDDDHRHQLQDIVEAVHQAGGKIALQLQHNGRYAKSSETGLAPVAPSAIMSRITKETPKALTLEGIQEIKAAFIDGAVFAQSVGFDAVELMGSEGYLLNQFLSPLTNQRTDQYGGSFQNRMTLPLDIISGIREQVGQGFPVIYRMSGEDYMEGSTTREETQFFAKKLVEKGVDALNVGVGWHESKIPTVAASVPDAAFAHVVSAIRDAVDVPVIGANRIHTPDVAEEVLKQGQMDFVAPARPWLADAEFAKKAKAGDHAGLNLCISCNQQCLDHTLGHPPLPVGCLVNPKTGHEWEWSLEEKSHEVENVAVVGGGVAGLAVAKASAEQGNNVTVFEAKDHLGGHFYLASQIPSKSKFRETIRFYKTSLERLQVKINLATQPTIDELKNYDRVYLATGVVPYVPEQIKGVHLPHVVTYSDILTGKVALGKNIAIVGGGGIGSDVAHLIAQRNEVPGAVKHFFADYHIELDSSQRVNVTVVSRSVKAAKGIGPTTRWVLLSELRRLGVDLLKGYECKEITPEGLWVESQEDRQFIEADQVILCTGQIANAPLYQAIKDHVPTQLVGGSDDASELNAAKAIQQAYRLVYDHGREKVQTKS
ncbi:2,4-dienoyl-CoA reductase (NADPH2) [Pullulanibacillus pueri]|uniref:2,4-dienoyl-CoA reductase n=1 Tax=Pullulanibacillus pueri TaxID=1437324 RepID=A0A8J3EKQ4_9BACL|nr:FAD-dependent oxidoreductase [Pullulanibacillus pueri]MBM7680727.1 2,4-dienoyl-CoA reductase (NADPH2) [Pullulanibacillus pueri]GGH78100.1 2,4-dienoyl-CoA reductase [Pullulanibacillus pueri]